MAEGSLVHDALDCDLSCCFIQLVRPHARCKGTPNVACLTMTFMTDDQSLTSPRQAC